MVLSTGDPCGQRLPTFCSEVVEPCQRLLAPGARRKEKSAFRLSLPVRIGVLDPLQSLQWQNVPQKNVFTR